MIDPALPTETPEQQIAYRLSQHYNGTSTAQSEADIGYLLVRLQQAEQERDTLVEQMNAASRDAFMHDQSMGKLLRQYRDEVARLRTALQEISTLLPEWDSEIEEFATKDDPYYNGVRQCRDDLAAFLAPDPQETP